MKGVDNASFSFGTSQFSADAVAKYCMASGDTNPIHLDEKAALLAGFSTCIVPGGMLVFLMERAIVANFPQATIIEVRARFTAPLLTGHVVHCEGRNIRQSSTFDTDKMRLVRVSCRDKARKIVCLGDVLFNLRGERNNH